MPSSPDHHYVPRPSLLERWASRFLQRYNDLDRFSSRERSAKERIALRRVHKQAIIYAGLAGIVSGGLIGGGEVYMRQGLLDGMQDMSLWEQAPYWLVFSVVAGLISLVEILFLYWNALRAIGTISRLAGVPLQPSGHARVVNRSLARAALEFPSPRQHIYGIDPFAYVSTWKLSLQAVLYRMKVGVSSFLLRVVLRRVLGRAALRGLVPLITGPLYAVWNGVITRKMLKEAHEAALGPFAIHTLVEQLESARETLGKRSQEIVLQGVGEIVMQNAQAHPNHVLLLYHLLEAFGRDDDEIQAEWTQHTARLGTLGGAEKSLVLHVLDMACVMAGPLNRRKRTFLKQVHAMCDAQYDVTRLKAMRSKMLAGQRIEVGEGWG
ncbi:LBF_2804 family protein [Litchfieldella xinjiangensis]|uniref:LBF_2804 family protein n=1 Tax=Litchfieldella xinjiangensis TaxID=1166948 RepID=UPI0005B97CEB|nr:hypothetical protein [Halomonas xinjiangensis]